MKLTEINYTTGLEYINKELFIQLSKLTPTMEYHIQFRSDNMEGGKLHTKLEVEKLIMELNSLKRFLK